MFEQTQKFTLEQIREIYKFFKYLKFLWISKCFGVLRLWASESGAHMENSREREQKSVLQAL